MGARKPTYPIRCTAAPLWCILRREDYLKQLRVTQRQNILSAEEFALQLDKFEGILAELVSSICEGAFPIEPVSPRICSYCAFRGICRKEVGLSGF